MVLKSDSYGSEFVGNADGVKCFCVVDCMSSDCAFTEIGSSPKRCSAPDFLQKLPPLECLGTGE